MCCRVISITIFTLLILDCLVFASSYTVSLGSDGPIVKGGRITFTAVLYNDDEVASGSFRYSWKDDGIPMHSKQIDSESGIDTWDVTYNSTIYPQGPYIAQVTVCKYILTLYCYEIASNRVLFYINETLNGEIALIQKNVTRQNVYVSSADPVVHNVTLKKSDADFIQNAPTVLTYWFVDCTYYGFRRDFEFVFNYTKPDVEHLIEALVVADFTPIPPPTTTTTTTTVKPTTTTTTTIPTTTTPKSKSTVVTTSKPSTLLPVNITAVNRTKRELNDTNHKNGSQITVNINGTLVPYNGTFPYICNGTTVITDTHKTYGFFSKTIKVREPISKLNITGNNWLQHGDLLTLNVKCRASKNLKYCVQYFKGAYNITGNETCERYVQIEVCEFMIQRFFMDSMEHTVLIIVENEVSKMVTPVTVTVYKVKMQAQLSVIVVPVAFSLVAVVLIVFGVAYYLQNRSRFVVEVADFNFGQNYSDMEYKTFKERLRDSIANALFTRGPSPGSSEVPVWPPGRKYGSMTS